MSHKKMRMVHLLFGLAACYTVTAAPAKAALLEGQTLRVNRFHESGDSRAIVDSGNFVVGPGVELPGFGYYELPPLPALVDIDVSDRQILITLLIDQPPAFRETVRFADILDAIRSFSNKVRVNAATNWADFPDEFVSAAGNAISISLGGFQGLAGQYILLDVAPEPASMALLAFAVPLAMLRRGW